MFAPSLLAIVIASAAADDRPDVATLIKQLGAEAFDDRVAAYKALERIGVKVLPDLRAAKESDARVRVRVGALIESIGRQAKMGRFARPTMIGLNFRDQPLGEVVDALNDRHALGLSLRLGPEPMRGMVLFDQNEPKRLKELKGRKITLEAPAPLPFWEAIDRLCEVSTLHYGRSHRTEFGASQVSLTLMADRTGRGPVSDSGPFRVQLMGATSMFERDFTAEPAEARQPDAGDLRLSLAVLPEPGLMLSQNGALVLTDATDDRGRSLMPITPAGRDPGQTHRSTRTMSGSPSIQLHASLTVPDPSGTVIRRLRGRVPVIAVARGSDPIVIPLKSRGTPAQSISIHDMVLLVDELSLTPDKPASIRVTLRANRGGIAPRPTGPAPNQPDDVPFNRDRVLDHLEFHDAAGRRLQYQVSESTRGADRQGFYDRYRLTVSPLVTDGSANGEKTSKTPVPTELHFNEFVQVETEIPFDFRDIPMP